MKKKHGCPHCQKLKELYPEREYNYMNHSKKTCPILKDTECLNCGERGHTVKYCKSIKKYCPQCGKIGHTANNCSSELKPTYNISSITESIPIPITESIPIPIIEPIPINDNCWILMNKIEMDFSKKLII